MVELPPGAYRIPASPAEAEIRERGSRFRAHLLPVDGESEARRELEGLAERYPDATHHCWAWRLGEPPRERSSDAGEPSGTAGAPILRALAGEGLSDVLAVVIRWYGGTKLGRGGLARAYGGVTRLALSELRVGLRVPSLDLAVEVPYPAVGAVKRLVRPPEVELVAESYGESARLVLRVARHVRREVESALADLQVRVAPRRNRENEPAEPPETSSGGS